MQLALIISRDSILALVSRFKKDIGKTGSRLVYNSKISFL